MVAAKQHSGARSVIPGVVRLADSAATTDDGDSDAGARSEQDHLAGASGCLRVAGCHAVFSPFVAPRDPRSILEWLRSTSRWDSISGTDNRP